LFVKEFLMKRQQPKRKKKQNKSIPCSIEPRVISYKVPPPSDSCAPLDVILIVHLIILLDYYVFDLGAPGVVSKHGPLLWHVQRLEHEILFTELCNSDDS
jgi:hypothetical protein